jgi:hypothetical protein
MRKVALAIAASLVLAVVAPALSQPFADVPTDHWAFDAIAELAAKGIVEGYPDGTFKGDRAMTRYEMAMVVARLLARIEAIKVPAPTPAPKIPAPEVGRADIATLQRLINEFRAELAALGVRVTAVEEELAALRDRLDNVRVTGDVEFGYNMNGGGTVSPQAPPIVELRHRLTFRGRATQNVTAIVRAIWGAGAGTGSTMLFGTHGVFTGLTFDLAYLDMNDVLGINWRLGRQHYTLSPIGAANFGLLFDPGNGALGGISTLPFAAGTVTSGHTSVADGLLGRASFGPVSTEFGVWRHNVGLDVWTARAQFGLIPGWAIGISGVSQRRNGSAVAPFGAPNTSDMGWSVDVKGNLFSGIGFGAAYAAFNPDVSVGSSSNAWTVWANIDLGGLTGMTTFAPRWAVWYKNYGPGTTPLYSAAVTERYLSYPWNFRGWGTSLTLTFSPTLSATVQYETGTIPGAQHSGTIDGVKTLVPAAAGSSLNEWHASIDYSGLAPRTTLSLRYRRQVVAGTTSHSEYRVQLIYSY